MTQSELITMGIIMQSNGDKWISSAEKLPPLCDGFKFLSVEVLAWTQSGNIVAAIYNYRTLEWNSVYLDLTTEKVTHWRHKEHTK